MNKLRILGGIVGIAMAAGMVIPFAVSAQTPTPTPSPVVSQSPSPSPSPSAQAGQTPTPTPTPSKSGGGGNSSSPLQVFCVVDKTTIPVGELVTWSASVQGGLNPYEVSWSSNNDDQLTINGYDASVSYTTGGVKRTSVTVADSDGRIITKSCGEVTVAPSPLIVSCSATPDVQDKNKEITWGVSIQGGVAPFEIAWSGDNGLSGSTKTVKKTYSTSGPKNASVMVASDDGQVITKSCQETVAPLIVSCSPSVTQTKSGNEVNWDVSVSGGEGPYTIAWTGDESLSGSSTRVSKSYSSNGDKNASVTVADERGQIITKSCGTVAVGESDGDDDDNGGGGSSGGRSPRRDRGAETVGDNQVPGNVVVFGSCSYLTEYLKFGGSNNPAEVRKLQLFLLNNENLDVSVTGVFDQQTLEGVKAFQARYVQDIMGPWGATIPSGQVYISTLKKVNELYCMKTLAFTAEDLAIFEAYRTGRDIDQDGGVMTGGISSKTPSPSASPKDGEMIGEDGNGNEAAATLSIPQRIANFFKRIFNFIFGR